MLGHKKRYFFFRDRKHVRRNFYNYMKDLRPIFIALFNLNDYHGDRVENKAGQEAIQIRSADWTGIIYGTVKS